jgi:GMP synthase (glutamine-hydrolysing)
VQYHPEYDLREVAAVVRRNACSLVRAGALPGLATAERSCSALLEEHRDPERDALREALALGRELLDPAVRLAEIGNWLRHLVLPRSAARAGSASPAAVGPAGTVAESRHAQGGRT